MPTAVGLITARGGSKGIPRKNLQPLAGRPLIAWTIEAARASGSLARVILSTEDDEIAAVCKDLGVEAPFRRPPNLARDDTPHIDVLLHALDWLEANGAPPDYLVTLQPTSPLRTAADIDGAVRLALVRRAEAVVSVRPAQDHPLLTRSITPEGTLEPFLAGHAATGRRQDLPPAFVLNGAVYVNRCESLRRHGTLVPPRSVAYVMPPERSLDIDHPWDLALAELMLRDRRAPG